MTATASAIGSAARRSARLVPVRANERPGRYRFPFTPYPTGWYALGRADEFPAGAVRTLERFGRELVVFRGESGGLGVLDAICPHLGAHLGAGRVRGDELVCAFHGFGFAADGRCTSLSEGYGSKIPPRLACGAWPTRVVNGFLVVHFDAAGAPPAFEVPELDLTGWRPIRSRAFRVRTHPQETGEGSVDLGHLRSVHQYLSAEPLAPPEEDGPRLRTSYRVRRKSAPGMTGADFAVEFTPQLHGLGYSVVDVHVPSLGLEYRLWILATPIDEEHIDYRVALAMKPPARPSKLNPALGLLPRAVATRLIETITWKAFLDDVRLDFPIWEQKGYVHPPALAAGDGPIGLYRRWATQFYPPADEPVAAG